MNCNSQNPTKPSYTFGVSRVSYEKVHTDGMTFDPNCNPPGPGSYQMQCYKETGTNSSKYSMRNRTIFCDFMKSNVKTDTPGPGNYSPKQAMSSKGSYFI